jgi:hypothetical protein
MQNDDEKTTITEEEEKAWRYVGRFLSGFAAIEGAVDRALCELFDLKRTLFFLLAGNLDFRKKLSFIKVAMERQKIDGDKVLKLIHRLHDIRNLLAHSHFTAAFFHTDEGIEFEHVTKEGKFGHSKFEAKETTYRGNFIPYSQLDACMEEMSHIEDELIRIGASLSPIGSEHEDFAREVQKAIEASENVVRFPNPNEE